LGLVPYVISDYRMLMANFKPQRGVLCAGSSFVYSQKLRPCSQTTITFTTLGSNVSEWTIVVMTTNSYELWLSTMNQMPNLHQNA